jgi:hypothetical protein
MADVKGRTIKGVVVIHKNVGSMAPTAAKKFIREFLADTTPGGIAELVANLKASGYDVLALPHRGGTDSIEVLKL